MTRFFYELTRRNWGAPWHAIIVALFGSLWLKASGAFSFNSWQVQLGTVVLVLLTLGYESWQIKKDSQTLRGALEDASMNLLGYMIAIIPLIDWMELL